MMENNLILPFECLSLPLFCCINGFYNNVLADLLFDIIHNVPFIICVFIMFLCKDVDPLSQC